MALTTASAPRDLSLDEMLAALPDLAGRVATREFERCVAYKQDGLFAWVMTLRDINDVAFTDLAHRVISDAAQVSRFPRGFEDIEFKASAVHFESQRRFDLAHPDEDCNASSLYNEAYNRSVTDYGFANLATPHRPCTCATGASAETANK